MQSQELKTENYIQIQEKWWLEKFTPFIPKAKVLKIGNGLGHLSESIRHFAQELTIIDIETSPKTINKDHVQLYSGYPIPYHDKSFDTTVIVFTLHHTPQSSLYFKEILRVTSKRIILLEETYSNVFQKMHLYFRDWLVNKKAGQSVDLYWNSYFSRKEIRKLIQESGLNITYTFSKRHKTYFKELFVLELN
ncbi:MAG: methyltransferase domain-containing protein [Candidatus Paceibacterota bacterium]